MIAATVLALLIIFGAGGGPFGELMSKYIKDPIKTTVVDEERREMALNELDELKDAINDFNKQVSKDIKQVNKLVSNYESTPEEFDQIFSSVFTKRKQEVEKIWRQRSTMLAHIQADEWRAIISSAKAEVENK